MSASLAKAAKDLEWDYDSVQPDDDTADGDSVNELPAYDRRELRRRLSLDSDHEEEIGSQISARIRRSILRERLNQRQNLQICFMQDEMNGESGDMDSDAEAYEDAPQTFGYTPVAGQENGDKNQVPVSKSDQQENMVKVPNPSILSQLFGSFTSKSSESEMIRKNFSSFDDYHKHIHMEAKKALKSAKEMAKMQMQLEKQQSKASKILGIQSDSCHEDAMQHPVDKLQGMTRMQLRLLITKIVNRTEQLNVSLLKMLEERDELHMEQDSLLVDIQDLTQFLNSKN